MVHAGRVERGDLQLKKLRKAKKKREMELSELTEEEREEYLKQKYEKTLKEKVGTLLWDWENHQLPRNKELFAIQLAKDRLTEIDSEVSTKIIEGLENPAENYKVEVVKIKHFIEVVEHV